MNIYSITFQGNEVSLCKQVDQGSGVFHYEQQDGQLLYATFKAENEDNALTIARFIAQHVSGKATGTAS